nr:immunoglobulin heavy chain junction region [Mus musculus]
LLCSNLWTYGL